MANTDSIRKRSAIKRAGTEKRRPQILRAAAKLFQRQGYHATTMDEVANAVRLNKATVYYHFPGGKTDLLFAIHTSALDEVLDRLQRFATSGEPYERLQRAIDVIVQIQIDLPDESIVLHEEARWLKNVLSRKQNQEIAERIGQLRAFIQNIIDDGINHRVFEKGDSAFVAAWIVRVAGSAFQFSHNAAPDDLPALYGSLLLNGVIRRD